MTRYDCLRILGLGAQPTDDEIRQAYLDLVKVWHPDRFTQDQAMAKKAGDKMTQINEAYKQLARASTSSSGAESVSSRRHRYSGFAGAASKNAPPRVLETRWASLLATLLGLLLFGLAWAIFHDRFHPSGSDKSVRDIT